VFSIYAILGQDMEEYLNVLKILVSIDIMNRMLRKWYHLTTGKCIVCKIVYQGKLHLIE